MSGEVAYVVWLTWQMFSTVPFNITTKDNA